MRKKIGMIYQLFNLVERTSVLENVMAGALGRFDKGVNLISSTIGIFNKKRGTRSWSCLSL
jgi:phosphonate transport system ATP-binding protein